MFCAVLVAGFVVLLVVPLHGASAQICQGTAGNPKGCLADIAPAFSQVGDVSFTNTIKLVIQTFLSLLGVIFIGMILFAGYNWMTAMGDKEKVTKAKDTLISAVIGLVLIIASFAITTFVLQQLGTK